MHPMMEKEPGFLHAKEKYQNQPYFLFWDNKDDIYEIINDIDVLIYDYSSIFNDFLLAGVKNYIRYIFDDDDMEATDTILMDKVSTPHSDDPGCPYHVWHKVTAVRHTHYLIDTIIIVHPDINYDGLENFQIHFITE